MASRTREARKPASPLSVHDIHELLTAINKIEKRDRLQEHEHGQPLHPPTYYHPRRIAEVLDSLASLSVSKERHEVIATALRVRPSRQSVELIVAGNAGIPTTTLAHIKEMWDLHCIQRWTHVMPPSSISRILDTPVYGTSSPKSA